jgi:hypothetical protein
MSAAKVSSAPSCAAFCSVPRSSSASSPKRDAHDADAMGRPRETLLQLTRQARDARRDESAVLRVLDELHASSATSSYERHGALAHSRPRRSASSPGEQRGRPRRRARSYRDRPLPAADPGDGIRVAAEPARAGALICPTAGTGGPGVDPATAPRPRRSPCPRARVRTFGLHVGPGRAPPETDGRRHPCITRMTRSMRGGRTISPPEAPGRAAP